MIVVYVYTSMFDFVQSCNLYMILVNWYTYDSICLYNHVICMFQFHCFNYVYEFSCKKMSLSAFSGVRRFRLLTMTFPDALNNRSEGTLVATKAKYFLTSLHISG